MSPFVLAVLVTVLAGAATIVGGLLATHGRLRDGAGLAASLSFAAAAMVTVSVAEIIPKGVDALGVALGGGRALLATLALVGLGAGIVFVVQRLVPRAAGTSDAGVGLASGVSTVRLRRSGLVVALVVAGHNLPEGLATFVATVEDPAAGIAIAVAIAVHNVPEGVAVATPVLAATGSRTKAVAYATGSGLAEPVGGVLGYLLLASLLPEAAFGVVFGVIAGMMIQISIAELLPAARASAGRAPVAGGFILGATVMLLSLVLLSR